MDMGQKIYHLRTQKGLTLEELGNMVGVGKSTVRKWENGIIANMKRDKIIKVSEALGTSPAYLMGWKEESPPQETMPDSMLPENLFPIKSKTAEYTPRADFYMKVKGTGTADARICDGDIVLIQKQDRVANGELAAVIINDRKEVLLKRLFYYEDKSLLILKSADSAQEDIIFMNDEVKNVQILGKAIAFQSYIK